jgi:arginase family enzyme
MRCRPEARVLWLDAHGDFNSPDTTPSGFLGGMCLAAACGVWDDGLDADPALDPRRVVMCGVRDLDDGERALLAEHGVDVVAPAEVADRLEGQEVYVHLDLDVLDPSVFPAQFPAGGGLSDGALRKVLGAVAERARVVGLEITAFEAPADDTSAAGLAELVTSVLEPLLEEAA